MVVELRPTLVEALEVIAAIRSYTQLQESHGQTPSAVLTQYHNELVQATARAGIEHPDDFEHAQDQIKLRTRMVV